MSNERWVDVIPSFNYHIATKTYRKSGNDVPIPDADRLITENPTIIIVIEYPLNGKYSFPVKNDGGFTVKDIAEAIAEIYQKTIYSVPQKYGVWGHCIGDLFLEKVCQLSPDYDQQPNTFLAVMGS